MRILDWVIQNLKVTDLTGYEPKITNFLRKCSNDWFSSQDEADMLQFYSETGTVFPLPGDYWGWRDTTIPRFDFFRENARTFAFSFENKTNRQLEAICFGIFDLQGIVRQLPESLDQEDHNREELLSRVWVPRAIVLDSSNIIPEEKLDDYYTACLNQIRKEWPRVHDLVSKRLNPRNKEIWEENFKNQVVSIHYVINSVDHKHISVLRQLGSEITCSLTHFNFNFNSFLNESQNVRISEEWKITNLKQEQNGNIRDKLANFYNQNVRSWYGSNEEMVDMTKWYSESGQLFPLPTDFWGISKSQLNHLTFFKDNTRTFAYAVERNDKIKGIFFGIFDLQLISKTALKEQYFKQQKGNTDTRDYRVARILFFDVSNILSRNELEEILPVVISNLGEEWSEYLIQTRENVIQENKEYLKNNFKEGIQSVHFTISNAHKNFISTLWKFDPEHTSVLSYLTLKTQEYDQTKLLDHVLRLQDLDR